mmetsp:Transcript_14537/g.34330  ORF Transcript_14537/g.34330 Transcript_14537/m.34330 type:complete len:239 (-) Transcript_14537:940-1656(-)
MLRIPPVVLLLVTWEPPARTLLTPLSLQMLTSKSLSLEWMPTHMPAYTSSPGVMNICPRFSAISMAYAVAVPPAIVTMDPFSRSLISSPVVSPQCENREFVTEEPRVLCNSLPCMPIRFCVGASNVITMVPSTAPLSIFFMTAPFFVISSITAPWYSASTSTTHSSYGSCSTPVSGSLRMITFGAPIMSSKPSLRMLSTRIPSCKVPRPFTRKRSLVEPGSTLKAKLVITSFCKRLPS